MEAVIATLIALSHICALVGAFAVSKETERMEQCEQGGNCSGNGCECANGCPECAAVVKLLRFIVVTGTSLSAAWSAFAVCLVNKLAG